MKKHSLIVEILIFSLILIAFIIPPFFTTVENYRQDIFSEWNFPLQQIFLALIAALLYFVFYEKKKRWLIFFPVLFTFCLLFCSSLFIKFFSVLFTTGENSLFVKMPESFMGWFFCLLNFFLASFYEEVLYRMYFPDALGRLFENLISWKYLWIVFEIVGALVFAFAHLYMGIFSVINALLAHIILRVSFKKCGSIWPCIISHFAYNVISLILL